MTQTTDTTAAIAEARRRLSEMPCLQDWGWGPASGEIKHPPDCICQGTGRAFPWDSEECVRTVKVKGQEVFMLCKGTEDCQCNGSGRVPKAVGLEELLVEMEKRGVIINVLPSHYVYPELESEWSALVYTRDNNSSGITQWNKRNRAGEGETPLLAALLAVERQRMKTVSSPLFEKP